MFHLIKFIELNIDTNLALSYCAYRSPTDGETRMFYETGGTKVLKEGARGFPWEVENVEDSGSEEQKRVAFIETGRWGTAGSGFR